MSFNDGFYPTGDESDERFSMEHEGKTLGEILGDILKRRHGVAGFYPCGGEVEDDGFVTVYSSVPVHG